MSSRFAGYGASTADVEAAVAALDTKVDTIDTVVDATLARTFQASSNTELGSVTSASYATTHTWKVGGSLASPTNILVELLLSNNNGAGGVTTTAHVLVNGVESGGSVTTAGAANGYEAHQLTISADPGDECELQLKSSNGSQAARCHQIKTMLAGTSEILLGVYI